MATGCGSSRSRAGGAGAFPCAWAAPRSCARATSAGARRFVRLAGMDFVLEREVASARPRSQPHTGGLESPMPGVVTRVLVAPGDAVKQGEPLVVLEAM